MENNIKKDIKKIIFNYLSYYKLFAALIAILLVATYFFNKTLTPSYKNSTSLHMVKDISGFFSTDFSFETSLNSPAMGMRYGMGLDDELVLLNSFSAIQKTLKELNFEINFFEIDTIFPNIPFLNKKIKNIEIYGELPIKIQYDASHNQPVYKDFTINIISDSTYRIVSLGNNGYLYNYIDKKYIKEITNGVISEVLKFNEVLENDILRIQVTKTEYFSQYPKGTIIGFSFNDLDNLTLQYKNSLSFSQSSPTSAIINIELYGGNYHKITNFLNHFADNLLEEDLNKKNILAKSTINFIDAQLGDISDSLSKTKNNLARFRSVNKITDLSFQGQRLFDIASKIENEKATLNLQEKYYTYLIEYLENDVEKKELVSPASMNIVDPILTAMISQLGGLYSQYNNYSESSINSIYLKDLKIKIDNQENAILENATNNLRNIQMSINELEYRLQKSNKQIAELPRNELKLIDIEREFKLNDAVLTFLMQKRSEAQIATASTQPSYEIIEPARYFGGNPVAPKKNLNYIIALIVGLFIPFVFILIKDFLDDKVRDKHSIKDISKYTFLGNVQKNSFKSKLCVHDQPESIVSESIRAIRTNLQFVLNFSESKVIAVTSSSSGEGKSFIAANLAASFAMSNFKTVLLEFDLRRPQIGNNFGLKQSLGLTSYLSNNATIDDIVIPLEKLDKLDIILSGSKAPNPADLVASNATKELFDYLKTTYDIIIIDTAPVGIVSESFYLLKLSDLSLFVSRQDYSSKELASQTLEQIENANINNKLAVLLNDVSGKTISKYQQSGYSKYYVDDKANKGFLNRLFS